MIRDRLPWYDIVFILLSLVSTGYIFTFFDLVQTHAEHGVANPLETILVFILIITLFEAARRLIGPALPIVTLFFVIHFLFTDYFPGFLRGKSFSLEHLTTVFYLGEDGIFGVAMGVAATIVIVFILFAEFLRQAGAADFFLDLAKSLFGTVRGGPAKIAVLASAFFATLSGTPSGNVAATGSVTIPLMKSIGYKPHFAGAVEAVASKGGQITPPVMGTVVFIMVELTGISYMNICIAAALPALLYFSAIFWQVDFEAAKTGLKGLPRDQLPSFMTTMKQGWQYLLPIMTLVVFIFYLNYEPEMAAIYSLLVLVAVTSFQKKRRMGLAKLLISFENAAKAICIAGIACALAGAVLGSIMGTGLGVTFSAHLLYLSGHNLEALLGLTAIACYIMGMGMTSVAIYVILATLVAPALIEAGVKVAAAHLFVLYWGNIAFITPPVCTAAYVAASIAKSRPMQTGWCAVRLGIVSFIVPFMFVYNPALIMMGSPLKIVIVAITSMGGVILLAAGIEGYLFRPIGWIARLVFLSSGFFLIHPGLYTDFIALAIAAPLVFHQARSLSVNRHRHTQTSD